MLIRVVTLLLGPVTSFCLAPRSQFSHPLVRPNYLCLCLSSNNDDGESFSELTRTTSSTGVDETSESSSKETKKMRTSRETLGPSMGEVMSALGTSPRRVFISLSSAVGIGLAGNLFGVTSNVLQAVPEDLVEQVGLDTYYPRGNYKRYNGRSYSLLIPKEWVADTALELAKAQQRTIPLDLTSNSLRRRQATLPDAAFGPPGGGASKSGAITNVSILVTDTGQMVNLKELLGGRDSQDILQTFFAGTRRTVNLEKSSAYDNLYQFTYTVVLDSAPNRKLRAQSVLASKGTELITLTAVAPVDEWDTDRFDRIATSFHLR